MALALLYILCNIYNLQWLLFPCFGKLSRVMAAYKYNIKEREKGSGKSDEEILGDLYDIYYNNRDLRLLLDLLATSSGVAPAIAIMTLFDKVRRTLKFRKILINLFKEIPRSNEAPDPVRDCVQRTGTGGGQISGLNNIS